MDRDYMIKLEERNQLLSKENEILLTNYNKLQNDLIQIKGNQMPNEDHYKYIKYEQLNQKYLNLLNEYNILQGQFYINKKKVIDMANLNNQLENDNLKLKSNNNKMKNELNKYI